MKNTACPGILLENKVHSKMEICFPIFMLFTAPIIPQIKHLLESLVLQISDVQNSISVVQKYSTLRAAGSFL